MPRGPRLDAPGTLHHVIARGIERKEIFRNKIDYTDFIERLEVIVAKCNIQIYAWALIPNHFHLLIKTGSTPLSSAMRKIMTGYAVNFNRRHKRSGYLFQNRYKSIICEEDPYLQELVRYIHLNPYRAGIVKSFEQLDKYPWSGHSVIMGRVERNWQNTDEILALFGKYRRGAIKSYKEFIRDGLKQGERKDLTGGGLIRSAGGWSEVLSLKRNEQAMQSDSRILGSGEFVVEVIREAEKKEKETLRLRGKGIKLEDICNKVTKEYKTEETELRSGSRRGIISDAREDVAQIAIKKYGISGAETARYLGVTASCINRIIRNKEVSIKGQRIIKLLGLHVAS